jgi:hypothetical protein
MAQNQNILQTTKSLKPANVSKTNITSLQHMALKIPPAQAQNPSTQFWMLNTKTTPFWIFLIFN